MKFPVGGSTCDPDVGKGTGDILKAAMSETL